MAISELTSVAKLLLDMVKFFREELKDRESVGPLALGALIQLYGECTRLEADLPHLRAMLEDDLSSLDETQRDHMASVLGRIGKIGEQFWNVDIELLNLYYPGAGDATRRLFEQDVELNSALMNVATTFGIDVPQLDRRFDRLLREYRVIRSVRWEFEGLPWRYADTAVAIRKDVDNLADALAPIRELLAHIITSQWTLKELVMK